MPRHTLPRAPQGTRSTRTLAPASKATARTHLGEAAPWISKTIERSHGTGARPTRLLVAARNTGESTNCNLTFCPTCGHRVCSEEVREPDMQFLHCASTKDLNNAGPGKVRIANWPFAPLPPACPRVPQNAPLKPPCTACALPAGLPLPERPRGRRGGRNKL